MKTQSKKLDFSNQEFYVGIDVHKKSWTVTVISNDISLKTFRMNPSSKELSLFMEKRYPKGNYISVYEAGFSGYGTHRELASYGFTNIIVNPSSIPTTAKEKLRKTDSVDSRKLARELSNGTLHGIYIPPILEQELRSLSRLRFQQVKKQTRIKNQIKSYLNFYGHELPENSEMQHWSRRFIEHLQKIEFAYSIGKEQLHIYIDELLIVRSRIDPALTLAYNNYLVRLTKQEAIVRIAKKLLNRIYYVLNNEKEYVCSVVK